MLSEQILELLTAFVDGELSQRQRKAVMRVLQRSSEARDVLRQLQENAHRVKKLPRHKVERSLVDQVMEAIVGASKTGKVGDGKIFVTDILRVLRIRTGETDNAAL